LLSRILSYTERNSTVIIAEIACIYCWISGIVLLLWALTPLVLFQPNMFNKNVVLSWYIVHVNI
jgi:hypothetical protein